MEELKKEFAELKIARDHGIGYFLAKGNLNNNNTIRELIDVIQKEKDEQGEEICIVEEIINEFNISENDSISVLFSKIDDRLEELSEKIQITGQEVEKFVKKIVQSN